MCHSQHVLGKLQPSPCTAPAQQFIFGNSSGKQFDQFIAWKAKRKSRSIVPPWAEASGRVVIYSGPALGLVSPRGWGFPFRCFVGSRTSSQQSALCSPKRGSTFGSSWLSSTTAATPAHLVVSRWVTNSSKKPLPWNKTSVEKGKGTCRMSSVLAQHRNRAHVGTGGYLSLKASAKLNREKFPFSSTTRTCCCSKIKAHTLKRACQHRGCRRAGHKPHLACF